MTLGPVCLVRFLARSLFREKDVEGVWRTVEQTSLHFPASHAPSSARIMGHISLSHWLAGGRWWRTCMADSIFSQRKEKKEKRRNEGSECGHDKQIVSNSKINSQEQMILFFPAAGQLKQFLRWQAGLACYTQCSLNQNSFLLGCFLRHYTRS